MTVSNDAAQPPTRAVIYTRISQDRTGAGLGIDRQREDCQALADRNGWQVVETYVDNDLSAYSGKPRPGYRRMLNDLDQGVATIVIAWHTDRLHRSNKELEGYIDLSQRRGVNTHTVQGGIVDLSTSSGRMMARMLGAVATHESEHKAERVARARLQKAKAGEWGGGIRPFGWGVRTGEKTTKVDRESGEEIEVPVLDMNKAVPEEAAAIEVGHDTILSGGSLNSWVKWLADKGLTTTRGNPIGTQEARDYLLRARNAGIAIYKGEEIGKGTWAKLVPEEKHRAVVAILKDPSRRTTPGSQPRWLGSLIYRCGRPGCTAFAYVTQSGGRRYPSYRCQTAHGGGRHAAKLDEYVQDIVIERLSQDDAQDLLLPGPEDIDVAGLQVESEQIRQRMRDLGGLFGTGQIDMVAFTEGTDSARAQLEGVTQQLARAATKDPLVELVGAPDVRKAWKAMELPKQRAILRELVDVTLMPPRPGRMPDGGYFDYEAIHFRWKRGIV